MIDADGHARHAVDITVGGSPMMHDFALTGNHVVLLDLPVTFDPRAAAAAMMPALLRMPHDWCSQRSSAGSGYPTRSPR